MWFRKLSSGWLVKKSKIYSKKLKNNGVSFVYRGYTIFAPSGCCFARNISVLFFLSFQFTERAVRDGICSDAGLSRLISGRDFNRTGSVCEAGQSDNRTMLQMLKCGEGIN